MRTQYMRVGTGDAALVEACIEAAELAGNLETVTVPKSMAYICEQHGWLSNLAPRTRCWSTYEHAWASFWWYEDYPPCCGGGM